MNDLPGRKLAVYGAWMQLGPVFGLLGSVIAMVNTFNDMAEGGTGDPEALADHISVSLITTFIGLVVGLIGVVMLGIALFGHRYRAPWFFTFLIVYSIIWMLNFPIGTILGVLLLIYVLKRKDEFHSPATTA